MSLVYQNKSSEINWKKFQNPSLQDSEDISKKKFTRGYELSRIASRISSVRDELQKHPNALWELTSTPLGPDEKSVIQNEIGRYNSSSSDEEMGFDLSDHVSGSSGFYSTPKTYYPKLKSFLDLTLCNQTINEPMLLKIQGIDWRRLSKCIPLSAKALKEKSDQMDWQSISSKPDYDLDFDFIKHFGEYLHWNSVKDIYLNRHFQKYDEKHFISDDKICSLVFDIKAMPFERALQGGFLSLKTLEVHIDQVIKHPERLLRAYHIKDIAELWDPFNEIITTLKQIPNDVFNSCQSVFHVPDKFWPIMVKAWSRNGWSYLLERNPPSIQIIDTCISTLQQPDVWKYISSRNLPIEFIDKHSDKIIWFQLFKCHQYDEQHLEKWMSSIKLSATDIESVCRFQRLSECFIEKFFDKLHIPSVCSFQTLSETFIRKRFDDLNIENLCRGQKFSEKFMKEYRDKLDWFEICQYQRLSESFMEDCQDNLNWGNVSQYQPLSRTFLIKYRRRLNQVRLGYNKNITSESQT